MSALVDTFLSSKAHPAAFSEAPKEAGVRYCVVPIVNGEAKPASYDFWAVGTNCCEQNFKCGELLGDQELVTRMFS